MRDRQVIDPDSLVDAVFQLEWRSAGARHTDAFHARRINLWRDLLPPALRTALMGRRTGDRLQAALEDGGTLPDFSERQIFALRRSQFDDRRLAAGPRPGRFYPKGLLGGVAGVFRDNHTPFRCVGVKNGHLHVDFNHPLAGRPLRLSAVVGRVAAKGAERGGTSTDWLETIAAGPGMQARWRGLATDFFEPGAMRRADERPDAGFYRRPRFVHHLDAVARSVIADTYGRFLEEGMRVLDLMASWHSHLPPQVPVRVVGLGLNAAELAANPALEGYIVQDLNAEPRLPFEAGGFDLVVNTASVEYLTDPLAVFEEVRRVLRPGGRLVVAFSNRWFPPKAIGLWPRLHEFERLGLVLEYFHRAGGYEDLGTYTLRGVPRPADDKYFPRLRHADPVFVAWGRKAGPPASASAPRHAGPQG